MCVWGHPVVHCLCCVPTLQSLGDPAWQSRPCDHLDVTFPIRTPCAPDLMPAEVSSFQCTPALQPGLLEPWGWFLACLVMRDRLWPGKSNRLLFLLWLQLHLHHWGLSPTIFKLLFQVGPSFQARGGYYVLQLKTLADILVSLFLCHFLQNVIIWGPPFHTSPVLEEGYVPATWRPLPWSLHDFIAAAAA